jgi:hypothetical protein
VFFSFVVFSLRSVMMMFFGGALPGATLSSAKVCLAFIASSLLSLPYSSQRPSFPLCRWSASSLLHFLRFRLGRDFL